MFDITSSKLLLLAIVALLVIGPKDFPILLRTIGKYIGIIRGHAKEFRAQFDEAMRDSELGQIKKDMEKIGRETEESLTATKQSMEQTLADARQGVEASVVPPVSGSAEAVSTALSLPPAAAEVATPPAEGVSQPPVTPEPANGASAASTPPSPPSEPASQTEAASQTAAPKTSAAPAAERTGA